MRPKIDMSVEYTRCLIEFTDDKSQQIVIIKSTDAVEEPGDDQIFYYGMSRQELVESRQNWWTVDNEWEVVQVYETKPTLEELL